MSVSDMTHKMSHAEIRSSHSTSPNFDALNVIIYYWQKLSAKTF